MVILPTGTQRGRAIRKTPRRSSTRMRWAIKSGAKRCGFRGLWSVAKLGRGAAPNSPTLITSGRKPCRAQRWGEDGLWILLGSLPNPPTSGFRPRRNPRRWVPFPSRKWAKSSENQYRGVDPGMLLSENPYNRKAVKLTFSWGVNMSPLMNRNQFLFG